MSGGFFRGTSADQDTRFSNKQAKLMKSQKFPPELDHLVDITKVKMDIIRPWIANRVTELLGFEDEVLINFIYGLLEGKLVNGKEVQISLTGFMEKNTGKFMKELWTLLLSAQQNASGVPQQILDAKEEETRMKKAETDRIANEVQKKREKESREIEQGSVTKMDGSAKMKPADADLDLNLKHGTLRASDLSPVDEKKNNRRDGARGRSSRSPSRSMSRSFSDSRSYSDDRRKSRSVSKSPDARRRSISSERVYRSQRRRSISPRGRHSLGSPSPPHRRTSYFRRRSRSRSQRRSPSPLRRRLHSPRRSPSPIGRRRRSPSPMRRRSPSPARRRFPYMRRRSPSPLRRRSPPMRRRSPSPRRYRSPPLRRRSPFSTRQRSPSPPRRRYRRSSSTPRRRSPSPLERRKSLTPIHKRSPSLSQNGSLSPSPDRHMSSSPVRRRSPVNSPKEENRTYGRLSPAGQQPSSSLRLPPKDLKTQSDPHKKDAVLPPPPEKFPDMSDASMSTSDDKRRQMRNRGRSPRKPREDKPRYDSEETNEKGQEKNHSRDDRNDESKSSEKRSVQSSSGGKRKDHYVEEPAPERISGYQATESGSRPARVERREKTREMKSESSLREGHRASPELKKSPAVRKDFPLGEKRQSSYPGDGEKFDKKSHSRSNSMKESDQHRKSEAISASGGKVDHNYLNGASDSGSEESDKHIHEKKENSKHMRSESKEDGSDDYSSDSGIEDRKKAKRRRKEEKKLRKEEKRRRREERRRKREERRAEKLKLKNQSDDYSSDDNRDARRQLHRREDEEIESVTEQKRLEIELREKALEKLKAKKGMDH